MRKLSRWHWLSLSILGIACLAASIIFAFSRGPARVALAKETETESKTATTKGGVRTEVIRPTLGGIERQTIQPGSVIAFESADLFAKISGYLKSQNVDIGSRVKQGEALVEIDAPEFTKQVEQGKASLDQAKAQVVQAKARIVTAKAERDAAKAFVKQAEAEVERSVGVLDLRVKQYDRMKRLADQNAIDQGLVDEKLDAKVAALAAEHAAEAGVLTANSKVAAADANVQQAEADLVNAEANVEVAQAALEKSQVFVDYTKILSPYDGVVTKRAFFRGAFIRSADQGSLVPLLGVSRTDLMRVVVQIPDRDVPYISIGNPATVEIDALPGDEFQGKVSRMADAEDPETRTMRIEIDLPNPNNTLREGMYGRVTIQLNQGAKVFTIPSGCLVGSIDAGKGAVYVVEKGVARLQTVTVGSDNGVRIQILKGLRPDSDVVYRHNGALSDGTVVEVVPTTDKDWPDLSDSSLRPTR
jgi:HlyD family secretion protein